jgi:N6-L-threonylcarbamoyladenine synthase
MIQSGYEFSFSGLKSSVARHVETNPDFAINDVAASFVDACLDVLDAKLCRAIAQKAPASLAVVGGVAASRQLRARMQQISEETGVSLCLPPQKWATDNAAMIALATWDYIAHNARQDLEPKPNLRLVDV